MGEFAHAGRRGLLDGVSLSWKDNIDSAGIATEGGTRLLEGRVPGTDARLLADAAAQGIAAKDVTPFLLDRIYALTEGRSLVANTALVLNNARLAARIAAAGA